jgi:hypothetical protein
MDQSPKDSSGQQTYNQVIQQKNLLLLAAGWLAVPDKPYHTQANTLFAGR